MKVQILVGIPGSGKSTYSKGLPGKVVIVSADNFSMKDGKSDKPVKVKGDKSSKIEKVKASKEEAPTGFSPTIVEHKKAINAETFLTRMRTVWEVWMTQANSPERDIFFGSVVTYLPIEDWATFNGFKVFHICGTRRALPWERTSIL